jgi:hypothetical protein
MNAVMHEGLFIFAFGHYSLHATSFPGTYTFRFSDGIKDSPSTLVPGTVKYIH